MENAAKFSHVDLQGNRQEVDLDVTAYKKAGEINMSLTQYLEHAYPSSPDQGTTMSQFLQSSGMYLRGDKKTGLMPPTMKEVFDGVKLDAIVRPDGNNSGSISQRLLFPEVIMQVIQSSLTEDNTDFLSAYSNMIAQEQTVTSARIDQPVIDVTAPETSRAQPITQLTEPASMISITVSDKSYRIPTKSIGLTISDEAMEATTLDLVALTMTAQSRGERIDMVEGQLSDMISGSVDLGESALSSATFKASYDPAGITSAGQMTQKAWIKFLREDYKKMNMDYLIMDIDTALAIEGRANKPTSNNDDPQSPRMDSVFTIENLAINPPKVLLVDTAILGANTVVGIDSRFAIRRVININAAYQAIESYVMRRATSFRVDYGEISHRLYTDGWKKRTLTV